jgi:aldose 1-epimerase
MPRANTPAAGSFRYTIQVQMPKTNLFRRHCAAAILFAAAIHMNAATKIVRADFGKIHEAPIRIYTLTNQKGIEVRIMNYGGIVVSIKTPDRNGTPADIVLGFDSLSGYTANPSPFFGALVGRYANRIAHARFTLDGVQYKLEDNDHGNTLHGGTHGLDKAVWMPRELPDGGLELTVTSPDGDEGFPGNLKVTVVYHLTDANELKIDYSATTDKDTVVNLTNHSYFNLKGEGQGDILSHRISINADRFTPVDAGLIPIGELRPVNGTPFDFRKPALIGAHIEDNDEQLKLGHGYDHNWVLNKKGNELSLAARVEEPSTGRVLEVLTTQPGLQFYTGNFLDGTIHGKGSKAYQRRYGFCLETQHFPDSPNQPKFPTTELKPGETFHNTTVFRFGT